MNTKSSGKIERIGIVGGTGFVGRRLAGALTRHGYATRVLTRRRARHRELLVLPTCDVVQANVHEQSELDAALNGCDAVINLAGILNERRLGPSLHGARDEAGEERASDPEGFEAVHVVLPQKVAQACRTNGIRRLLHMSALKASSAAPSRYLQTKGRAEDAMHALASEGVAVTSFRPSVIFGPGDSFLNRFGALLRVSPLFLPLACPNARFAPVFVGDVAEAFVKSLEDEGTFGQRYELCGPNVYTLQALVEFTARQLGLNRRVLPLGDRIARLQAAVLDYAPGKPFSSDNYASLQVDSICSAGPGLSAFGIQPSSIEAVVPTYLGARNKTSRLRGFRQLARRG